MELRNVKKISFPKPSYEEWKTVVEAGLKGKTIDKLQTHTYEGVTLHPLYTQESVGHYWELPGFPPYTRGILATGYLTQPWLACQPISAATAEEANEKLKSVLNRGQNTITYSVDLLANGANLPKLLKDLPLASLPFFIDLKGMQKEWFPECKAIEGPVTGVLAEDPIAEWVVTGQMPEDTEAFFVDWAKTIGAYETVSPDLKTILIKTSVFHNGGAHAVQELAYALAVAVQYLLQGQKQGLSIESIASKMVFSFSIDSHYFMNIAKLRAARRLWGGLSAAFHTNREHFKMHIHAVTSEVTETLYDPYVNILRTTNQAFAAAIGGIQYMQIHPFNHATREWDDFSERIARNIHLILQEETQITRVMDPAGGSFYVEQLTDELADLAWQKFLEVDDAGGILESLKQGTIQAEITEVFNKKVQNVALRKERIIGTNVYPNPTDEVNVTTKDNIDSYSKINESKSITPIRLTRIAHQFESLRLRVAAYKQKNGESPKIGLINLQELKSYKPRVDFMKGLVAAGGIDTLESEGCYSTDDALTFVEHTKLPIYCICGSDDAYALLAEQFVAKVKEAYPEITIYLAGKPSGALEVALQTAGVKEFFHAGSNVISILTAFLEKIGVS
jgi:methylmalonyl-CoA mutase